MLLGMRKMKLLEGSSYLKAQNKKKEKDTNERKML